jgi:glycosyltransferase involved in cell wall biosynthesis
MATKKMRACIYSPYIPQHFGGGEKYLFDVAQVLAEKYDVSFAVADFHQPEIKSGEVVKRYESFLNTSLKSFTFLSSPLGSSASAKEKILWTKQFDLLYFLSDGSLFLSLAKKNILHLQIPFTDSKTHPLDRLKLRNWRIKNANSHFTQQIIQNHWRVKVPFVHYPLVELTTRQASKKQPIILHVGRFFRNLHTKRQDVLVDVFRQLSLKYPEACKDWKVVFIGAVEDQSYVEEVKAKAQGLPIEFYHNLSRKELETWYAKASIYWHATGFEVNEREHPERVEHFGISTAEAMMAGCVPLVVGKGGQLEVVGSTLKDWQWQTVSEAVDKTQMVMTNAKLRHELQDAARLQAQVYDQNSFKKVLWQMIDEA